MKEYTKLDNDTVEVTETTEVTEKKTVADYDRMIEQIEAALENLKQERKLVVNALK